MPKTYNTNLSQFEDAQLSGTIADGEYVATVEGVEFSENTKGTGAMLILTFIIILSNGFQKVVKEFLNLWHENKTVVAISASRLKEFSKACGFPSLLNDYSLYKGMQLCVRVGIDKDTGENRIQRFIHWKPIDNSLILMRNQQTTLEMGTFDNKEESVSEEITLDEEDSSDDNPDDGNFPPYTNYPF